MISVSIDILTYHIYNLTLVYEECLYDHKICTLFTMFYI